MRFLTKNIILLVLVFSFQSISSFSITDEKVLCDSAKIAYKKEDFKKAIVHYESILSLGFNSAELHFNLGNAYYKNEQIGRAILHYEISRKLNPANQDNNTNLGIASSKAIDKINVKENFFATTVKTGLFSLLSTDGWAYLSIGIFSLAISIFIIFFLAHSTSLKLFTFWLGVICIIAFVLSMGIGYSALHNLEQKDRAVVVATQVEVMGTPNETGKAKFNLHEGTRAIILETDGEWTSIILENGNEGWVKSNDIGAF